MKKILFEKLMRGCAVTALTMGTILYSKTFPKNIFSKSISINSFIPLDQSTEVLPFIPVLYYHNIGNPSDDKTGDSVSPEEFKAQMEYITKEGYKTISVSELYNFAAHKGSLPPKPIMITFDDGYESEFSEGFKILKAMNMKMEVSPVTFTIGKRVSNYNHLTPAEIQQMASSGLVDIGTHTDNMHAKNKMTKPFNENDITYESILETDLKVSLRKLYKITGAYSTIFTPPYGIFNDDIRTAALHENINTILLTCSGRPVFTDNILYVPRMLIYSKDTVNTMCNKLSGVNEDGSNK